MKKLVIIISALFLLSGSSGAAVFEILAAGAAKGISVQAAPPEASPAVKVPEAAAPVQGENLKVEQCRTWHETREDAVNWVKMGQLYYPATGAPYVAGSVFKVSNPGGFEYEAVLTYIEHIPGYVPEEVMFFEVNAVTGQEEKKLELIKANLAKSGLRFVSSEIVQVPARSGAEAYSRIRVGYHSAEI